MIIRPVILCGGSGTRLWPVSRRCHPKQFGALIGGESLFQQAVRRVTGEQFAAPVIVTGADYRFIVMEQLEALGVTAEAILIEPEPHNTAPAVLAAAHWLAAHTSGGLMLITPADHHIPDASGLHLAIDRACDIAGAGGLVTFGVQPLRPETGYGYLELEHPLLAMDGSAPSRLKRFVEKPCAAVAEDMVASGRHLWNAGIFLFAVGAIRSAGQQHVPGLMPVVAAAVDQARCDLCFVRLAEDAWSRLTSVSIDHAIMEKADNLWVVPLAGAWTDLGGWEAVWTVGGTGADGVAAHGPVTAIDCENSLLRSDSDAIELVAIGVKDMIAVATGDAVLLADRARTQDVRLAVDALRRKNAIQADRFPREHRPWGHFDVLARAPGFLVKRITVRPGAALSLQSHRHRAEHWVVVEGFATVSLNDGQHRLDAMQSIDIPCGARHRLANLEPTPLTVIEVQTGACLKENDIVRHDDIYARS